MLRCIAACLSRIDVDLLNCIIVSKLCKKKLNFNIHLEINISFDASMPLAIKTFFIHEREKRDESILEEHRQEC